MLAVKDRFTSANGAMAAGGDVLVTTASGKLLQVDLQQGKVDTLAQFVGKIFGISWNEQRTLYITESHDNKDAIEKASVSGSYDSVATGVVRCFSPAGSTIAPLGLMAPHQILYSKNRLYVCDSGSGALKRFECGICGIDSEKVLVDTGYDCVNGQWTGEHINSVYIDTCTRYLRHRFGMSAVSILEDDFTDESHPIREAHNLACMAGKHYVCNSAAGSLYCLDERRHVWSSPIENSFVRGLACFSDDVAVIGISVYEPERSRRYENTGYLALVCRCPGLWKTVRVIPLPGSGDVHDVRALGVRDSQSHNGILLSSVDTVACLARNGQSPLSI